MSCIVFGGMSQTFFFPHLKKKILKFFIFFPLGGGEVKFHLGVLSFSPLLFLNKTRSWRCFLFCTTALHTKKKKKRNQVQAFFFLKPSEMELICWCVLCFVFFWRGGSWIFVMEVFPRVNCWLVVCAPFLVKPPRITTPSPGFKHRVVPMERGGQPGDSGNMKDGEGRNNLKHKNLLQPCFVNFSQQIFRAELRSWSFALKLTQHWRHFCGYLTAPCSAWRAEKSR